MKLAVSLLAVVGRINNAVKISEIPVGSKVAVEQEDPFGRVTTAASQNSLLPYGQGPALLTEEELMANDAESHLREPLRQMIQKQSERLRRGPTVYFYGDSTVRNQWMAYCSLLNPTMVPPAPKTNADFGRVKPKLYVENMCTSSEKNLGQAAFFYTWGTWEGEFPAWARARKFPDADVLVFGIGHHILQQIGHEWNAGNARLFTSYEKDYAAFVDRTAELMNIPVRVLETDGSICENHFYGDWIVEDVAKSAAPCVKQMMAAHNANQTYVSKVCQESLFTRAAVVRLNNRLLEAYEQKGQGVRLADMFKVTDKKCDKTEDGVHFNKIGLEQLKEIFRAAGW